MVPNPKVAKACKAMKDYGIPEETVKPVLKKLLDLYDKNWKYIEDENYRVLIEAIFDHDNPKKEKTKRQEFVLQDEPEEWELPLKRFRLGSQTNQSSSTLGDSNACLSKTPSTMQHREDAQVSQTCCQQKGAEAIHQCLGDRKAERNNVSPLEHYKSKRKKTSSPQSFSVHGQTMSSQLYSNDPKAEFNPVSPQTNLKDNGEESVPLQIVQTKRLTYESGTHIVPWGEPKVMLSDAFSPEENLPDKYLIDLIVPEGKPFTNDLPTSLVPLAIILPGEDGSSKENCSDSKENGSEFPEFIDLDAEDISPHSLLCGDGSSTGHCSGFEANDLDILDSKHLDREDKEDGAPVSSQIDIASSPKGEVKISLICNLPQPSDFHIPSLDAVLKAMEEKYLKSYRITERGFSLLKLMKDMCECVLAEGTISTADNQVKPMNVPQTLDVLTKSKQRGVLSVRVDNQGNFSIPSNLSNGSINYQNFIEVLPQIPKYLASNGLDVLHCIIGLNIRGNGYGGRDMQAKTFVGQGSSNSSNMAIIEKHYSSVDLLNSPCYVNDITRGEENHKISLVNEISNECRPNFKYIPRNITYQNAYVKFLLARISDENCCSNCFGDCLSLAIPCSCAGETGGEFAYTPGGLVKEKFLEKCISMNQDPGELNFFYCKDCPLERSKDISLSGTCKGHLVRKFIKECWYKCGCSKKCGNRVVQRGITVNLQVFMTPEGKGWGLRTLEDLPKGAFICEYVGEIVTNTELFERNMRSTDEKHTYPVLLDADWGSEVVLKDEEALCLDATFYGNVARFVNHRCCDANLVEIPVEVETPDHHYYHLAFFTTRKVNALEELTWDYGIDFDDQTHPVKAFQCSCGSKFCRNIKRPKRTRSSSWILS